VIQESVDEVVEEQLMQYQQELVWWMTSQSTKNNSHKYGWRMVTSSLNHHRFDMWLRMI
jgi:hypothetical protein